MTILEAVRDPALFGPFFRDRESWRAWEAFLSALFGLKLTKEQLATYRQHTGRRNPPKVQVPEAWLIVGRRGGKSRIAALVAVYLACFRDYTGVLAPGERGTLPVIASDRQQARTMFRYITGLLEGVPMLSQLIENRTQSSIELTNRVTIEVHTASFRAIRGYTIIGAVCDEIAFWRSDESANPDTEILNGLRPGMATIPGALLLCISTPYARRGALWDARRRHHGQDGDPVLVWQAPTRAMNPTVDERVIADAYEQDGAAAAAEYGAEFREDVETFISREAVEAVVVPGRRELPPVPGLKYIAFVDPSGGSQDSMTLGIAHNTDDGRAVLDVVREQPPPFSPEGVVEEFSEVLKSYRVTTVIGDRYAGEWPRERFREHGIRYDVAERSKSELYASLLPAITSGRVELLDLPRLHSQLLGLERRTSRAGRDSIDHSPGGRDDVINAAAGALVVCANSAVRRFFVRQDRIAEIARSGRHHPFSREETNLRDGCRILAKRLDLGVRAHRACHLTLAPGGEAAALAVGYVKGLVGVRRTNIQVVDAASIAGERDFEDRVERLPVIVLEALLRIVPEKGDEIVVEEVTELVLRLRDGTGLPILWVTTFGAPPWLGPTRRLRERGVITGEVSPDDLRPYQAMKSAIYEGRLEGYDFPPFVEQLKALEDGGDRSGVPRCGSGRQGREVVDAAAGLIHTLMNRRESWVDAEAGGVLRRRSLGPRPSSGSTLWKYDPNEDDDEIKRQPGRINISRSYYRPG